MIIKYELKGTRSHRVDMFPTYILYFHIWLCKYTCLLLIRHKRLTWPWITHMVNVCQCHTRYTCRMCTCVYAYRMNTVAMIILWSLVSRGGVNLNVSIHQQIGGGNMIDWMLFNVKLVYFSYIYMTKISLLPINNIDKGYTEKGLLAEM